MPWEIIREPWKRMIPYGTVLDQTISSYIPTLRVLALAKKCVVTSPSDSQNGGPTIALLVQMPEMRGRKKLLHAVEEVGSVQEILKPSFQVSRLNCPESTEVKSLLNTCTMAHFACHGSADNKDPSQSQLLLTDWQFALLNISTLLRTPMPNCQFVYLSLHVRPPRIKMSSFKRKPSIFLLHSRWQESHTLWLHCGISKMTCLPSLRSSSTHI